MQLRTELQIASAIKALKDVIIPAIDPINKLAVEQAQLVVGMLALMSQQAPVQFRFDCDELARLIDAARQFDDVPASGAEGLQSAIGQLQASRSEAVDVLARCTVDPVQLTEQVRGLRQAMSDAVAAATASGPLAAQLQIERIVLAMSREQLLRDRSLMKLQGWEPEPEKLPDIGTLLAPLPQA